MIWELVEGLTARLAALPIRGLGVGRAAPPQPVPYRTPSELPDDMVDSFWVVPAPPDSRVAPIVRVPDPAADKPSPQYARAWGRGVRRIVAAHRAFSSPWLIAARREQRIQELELENARLKERIEEYERSYKRSAEVRPRCCHPQPPRGQTRSCGQLADATLRHNGAAQVLRENELLKSSIIQFRDTIRDKVGLFQVVAVFFTPPTLALTAWRQWFPMWRPHARPARTGSRRRCAGPRTPTRCCRRASPRACRPPAASSTRTSAPVRPRA